MYEIVWVEEISEYMGTHTKYPGLIAFGETAEQCFAATWEMALKADREKGSECQAPTE